MSRCPAAVPTESDPGRERFLAENRTAVSPPIHLGEFQREE